MQRRFVRVSGAVMSAVLLICLVLASMAHAKDPPVPGPAKSPLQLPLTPTLQLVGPDDQLLSSPLVCPIAEGDAPVGCTLRVWNPLTESVTIAVDRLIVRTAGGDRADVTLGLSPRQQVVEPGAAGAFTLSAVRGTLSTGAYTGTVRFSPLATGLQPISSSIVLQVRPAQAELTWVQDAFRYELDAQHMEIEVRARVRYTDVQGARLDITALTGGEGMTQPFRVGELLEPSEGRTLPRGAVSELTLTFEEPPPVPGTYGGVLRLEAENATPITAPLTLIVPDDFRGAYRLAYGEIGPSPRISPSLLLTGALQMSGVRRLPGSASAVAWTPTVGAAVLIWLGVVGLGLYVAWAWAAMSRRWIGRVALLGTVAVAGFLIWRFAGPATGWTEARVPDRDLLLWERTGRRAVRSLRVVEGRVVNQSGHEGRIRIGDYPRTIEPGAVVTVPLVGVGGVSQPGVYHGHLLITSPDLQGGPARVPVQVTVHDWIIWPIIVIMLGVIFGGWTKYQQSVVTQRLEAQKALENVWQTWDDHMRRDPYLYPQGDERDQVGPINPLYDRVRGALDRVEGLLEQNAEWGIQEADYAVEQMSDLLARYKQLSQAVSGWRRDLSKESPSELVALVEEAESQLRQGDLERTTAVVGRLVRDALPGAIESLLEVIGDPNDDEEQAAIRALLERAERLSQQGVHGEAWALYQEAAYRLRAQGEIVPTFLTPKALRPKGVRLVGRALGAPEEPPRYEIRPLLPRVRYRVGETMPLEVVRVADGESTVSPATGDDWRWHGHLEGDDSSRTVTLGSGQTVRCEFDRPGEWTIEAVADEDRQAKLTLRIRESGIAHVYRQKRRHSFNRRMAALILAVVGGVAAKEVYDLTFGSVAQYLYAFAWGVGVSLGIDPLADGLANLRATVADLLPGSGSSGEAGS